ncbi:MAG TPA: hypothetical protein DCQ31_09730 [Bacteroidales bacterium]|nr:hypothetical protein [Bacteroidales bacterium]
MKKIIFSISSLLVLVFQLKAQEDTNNNSSVAITTAIPILLIAPDSRSGAMGDAGVATSPDEYAIHWNAAKYAFIEKDFGFSLSYAPWLINYVPDINIAKLAGFKRLDENQAIAFSLLYFSYGKIPFTSNTGQPIGDYNPNELAIDGAYSLKLGRNLSAAIALRYIYSNLSGGFAGSETHPGHAYASDISVFYTKELKALNKSILNLGANFSNIGTKVSYSDAGATDFLPANMRLGAGLTMKIDDYNKISFTTDINKLLVPTPPIYDPADQTSILFGKDPEVSVITGILQSFGDAPGVLMSDGSRNVALEEFRELTFSAGVEYWYANQVAARAGYFHEHASKGNRKFVTVGLGIKLNAVGIDFAYLIPATVSNPLQNTVRFSLYLNFNQPVTTTKQ